MKTRLYPSKKALVAAIAAFTLMFTSACSSSKEDSSASESTQAESTTQIVHDHGDHPSDGGPAPAGMVVADDPLYPLGSEVIINADHMPGMVGSKGKVVGAFKTYTYSVDYMPTDGSAMVTDHRWVVQEELENVGKERLADGTEVTIAADHMKGMKGASGSIAHSTEETVYMVDFEAGGMSMKNHKWVTESELAKP